MSLEIQAVQLRRQQAMLSDGQIVPIVSMLDYEGEDTDAPEDARAIVAGPCTGGKWYTDSLEAYDFNQPASLN